MAALLLRSSGVQYQTDRSLLRFEFEKRGGPINQPSPVPLHRINSCGRPSESTVALTARPGFPLWTTLFTHSLLSPTNLPRRSKTWHRETDSLRSLPYLHFYELLIIVEGKLIELPETVAWDYANLQFPPPPDSFMAVYEGRTRRSA